MSTSGSPDTPEFAAPAETNTSGENTIATVSSTSILTDRRSISSNPSGSWNVVRRSGQTVVAPTNPSPIEASDRSRQMKRSDQRSSRSPRSSKSPRRHSEARGSDAPMTADQRLDQLLMDSARRNIMGEGRPDMGNIPMGSSPPNPPNNVPTEGANEDYNNVPTRCPNYRHN